MTYEERKSQVKSYLGKTVHIKIDRPIGYKHKKGIVYPINYGYIPDVYGGDGEELDVYLLGVDKAVEEYTVKIIGIIHRKNDVEDKLVGCPEGMTFNQAEIEEQVCFQEKFYEYRVESLYEKSCGTILYTVEDGIIKYLLILSENGAFCGFPKGHKEKGETDIETALRETWEETSVKAEITEDFKRETSYCMPNGRIKTVVYFPAFYKNQLPSHVKGFENNNYASLCYEDAYRMLTYDNIKEILKETHGYLTNNKPK